MIERLEFRPFEFPHHLGNRPVGSFGFRYDYSRRAVRSREEMPSWLDSLRRKIAVFAERAPDDFKQVGINEYGEGAGIGWHRDKAEFGDIVGVSLLSKATLRLRRETGGQVAASFPNSGAALGLPAKGRGSGAQCPSRSSVALRGNLSDARRWGSG